MSPIWPLDADERAALRAEHRKLILAEAERKAVRYNTTIKCGEYGSHADRDGGCANTGTNCLCACHDRRVSS